MTRRASATSFACLLSPAVRSPRSTSSLRARGPFTAIWARRSTLRRATRTRRGWRSSRWSSTRPTPVATANGRPAPRLSATRCSDSSPAPTASPVAPGGRATLRSEPALRLPQGSATPSGASKPCTPSWAGIWRVPCAPAPSAPTTPIPGFTGSCDSSPAPPAHIVRADLTPPGKEPPRRRAVIVIRFKVQCQPGKTEHALAVLDKVVAPSRALEGVISFDIGRDIVDPNSIIATEVFEDRAALDRQESLPEVAEVMSVLPQIVAAAPEATMFHVSSSEPHG
ncbi:MAG: hypothetical protein DMD33_02370 [Gemmatimonadetes bacterium]|nr:MAG: hypothetical protein DMD33_02370 [Gemmatimonadota bacterium]